MNLKKIAGFVDPITLGFLVALGGAALGLTQTSTTEKATTASAAEVKAPAAAVSSTKIVEAQAAKAN